MTSSTQELLKKICQAIADKKGMNIITIDVREISNFTDYFIVAEGTVDRHVKSISDAIESAIGTQAFRSEGKEFGDWIVLDFLDIVVHLFIPELREKYQIENVWKEGKIVEIPINYGRSE